MEKLTTTINTIISDDVLLRVAGDKFINWAKDYFTADKLNRFIVRAEMFTDYKNVIGQHYKTASNFKKSLAVWCEYMGYKFNPLDKIPLNEIGKHRKIIRIDQKLQEVFFIQV